MPARTWIRSGPPCVVLSVCLLLTPVDARAQDEPQAAGQPDLSSIRVVDALNLFPNVGALIYVAEPNDLGIPSGILTQCSGTLIHERVFLVAGHCTAANGGTPLFPFIKRFVTLSPNARDPSAWREVSGVAFHPSIPPCPPPDFCTFLGLDPGILDIGLVFLRRPVRGVEPAKLARPGTLESDRAAGQFMIVAGYGFLNSLPDGSPPPISDWDGLRRLKISMLRRVVDNEWATWSLPGIVCYGDSGAPTFFNDHPFASRLRDRIVAVASDGSNIGEPCFTRDVRARVDTKEAQDWIRQTIADAVGGQEGHD
jgi:Trypsin